MNDKAVEEYMQLIGPDEIHWGHVGSLQQIVHHLEQAEAQVGTRQAE